MLTEAFHPPISILLVSDQPDGTRSVQERLAGIHRYAIQCTHIECLGDIQQHFPNHTWQLVLYVMPEQDGWSTVVQARDRVGDAALILLHHASDTEIPTVAEVNAEECLPSTVEAPLLERAIRYAVERRHYTMNYRRLAEQDPLTGLLNRKSFRERLAAAMGRARQHGSMLALFALDLDRFKSINDTFGHAAGDRLLRDVASRLRDALPDGITIARLGGDEFGLLCEQLTSTHECIQIIEDIHELLRYPFTLYTHELHMTPCIGVATYPHCGMSTDDLLKHADIALHRAKQRGPLTYQFYSEEMNRKSMERMTLETRLRQALEQQEFQVYYQPQFDAFSRRITGAEALIRWIHPEEGMISPATFIPMAEETGLILPIGEFVMRRVCADMREWNHAGLPPIRVSVNLSAKQFQEKGLIQKIFDMLEEFETDPAQLALEVTESVIMDDAISSSTLLSLLRERGIHVHIDDFGTGYSSLSYLKLFPLDALKIDRSFVRNLPEDTNDALITNAIIGLAQNLGLEVIAEGVETEAQLAYLQEQGCSTIQGFLLGKPVPEKEFVKRFLTPTINP
jgi:diguanylate cyclase (GGDEF)-like protein